MCTRSIVDSLVRLAPAFSAILLIGLCLYLYYINSLMSGTPDHVRAISPRRWTREELLETYRRLEKVPIDYVNQIPPRQNRRYIVVGGSGLVGGSIVKQLLARGQAPESIRIVDFRRPERMDMLSGPMVDVDFVQADISSRSATDAAFSKPWRDPGLQALPLTVFHTAAVIVPSDRSRLVYAFPKRVNVDGTANVLCAARRAGADVLVYTSSASIAIRPVQFWVSPFPFFSLWRSRRKSEERGHGEAWPRHYFQTLDDWDLDRRIRRHSDFFGNYPASKAVAERLVCDANGEGFRTGCLRPANGVYGDPTDNTVGGPIHMQRNHTWTVHIVQPFVHAVNVALAHLQYEAILIPPDSHARPQAGRTFTITDPNPPITYGDLYLCLATLLATPFSTVALPPVLLLLTSYVIEAYNLLPYRIPSFLRWLLPPPITHPIRFLQPGLFSICTHLAADDGPARKPVDEGGLGYRGVLRTMEGMVGEVLAWNRENVDELGRMKRRHTSSVDLGEEIRKLGEASRNQKA